jgi:tetratricopeptide (TPR) repeat protein
VLTQLQRYDDAAKEFRAALRIDPHYFKARYNLGCMFENQGKLGEAANEYMEALKIRPNQPDATRRLGVVLRKLNPTSGPGT